jgi:hypothetical protein
MFEGLPQDDWIHLGSVILLAALPAIIWSGFIQGSQNLRWPLLLAFFLGTLTVLPLILLYDYIWVQFPQLNFTRHRFNHS